MDDDHGCIPTPLPLMPVLDPPWTRCARMKKIRFPGFTSGYTLKKLF